MLTFMPHFVLGIISAILVTANTIVAVTVIYTLALVKLAVIFPRPREAVSRVLERVAERWVFMNNLFMKVTTSTAWNVTGIEGLRRDGWYLVISNHRSQLDILVLQKIFHATIPFLKFFIKKELIWVPLFGLAWWALDFPFMKRYSAEFVKKNPHLKGKDLEATRKACEKFRKSPISIVNYVEGTRFTPQKHGKQRSPYRNLLRPRAGGIGFVLGSMGDQLDGILDVTIVYPGPRFTLWDFMCNRVPEIRIAVKFIPLDESLAGDYVNDDAYRAKFQEWLNGLWEEKDRLVDSLSEGYRVRGS